jgi:hypothetical protein
MVPLTLSLSITNPTMSVLLSCPPCPLTLSPCSLSSAESGVGSHRCCRWICQPSGTSQWQPEPLKSNRRSQIQTVQTHPSRWTGLPPSLTPRPSSRLCAVVTKCSCLLQIITADPDVTLTTLLPDDKFFMIACDGVWDCFTNQEAVRFPFPFLLLCLSL